MADVDLGGRRLEVRKYKPRRIMSITKVLRGKEYSFETKPGLFSKNEVDQGSELLINTMMIEPHDIVLDLGCGYGAIGLVAANLAHLGKVYMADTDVRAVKFSKLNAKLNTVENVEILASDGFEGMPDIEFNVIVSNPPSHLPKETIREFVEGAMKQLKKGGRVYFVTERRIQPMVQREFERVFGNYEDVASRDQYVVSVAHRR